MAYGYITESGINSVFVQRFQHVQVSTVSEHLAVKVKGADFGQLQHRHCCDGLRDGRHGHQRRGFDLVTFAADPVTFGVDDAAVFHGGNGAPSVAVFVEEGLHHLVELIVVAGAIWK